MPLRIPPGRGGRVWLAERLERARRAVGVMDQKRAVLAVELERAARAESAAAAQWEQAAARAERWLRRAVVPGGGARLELVAAHLDRPAEIEVEWRGVMGVEVPGDAPVRPPDTPDLVALGAASALMLAADAHADALQAAARHAAAAVARRRLEHELRLTVRRLRAVEKRWIPRQERALRELELRLDEMEREDAARLRLLEGAGTAALLDRSRRRGTRDTAAAQPGHAAG
jgi:V/A-type H+/Na+-transporting ATPase subunit D